MGPVCASRRSSHHDPTYGNPVAFGYYGFPIMYTAGSAALRGYFNAMRQAGAQARKFLLDAAAEQLSVPVEELSTEPSRVVHAASGESLSIRPDCRCSQRSPRSLPEVPESEYKPRSEYRYLGTDVPRIDVPAKVDGSAEFGIDVQIPGMVHASVLRTPVEGEEPLEVDDSAARAIPGVTDVVTLPYGVAVVGETVEGTIWGKNALQVTWSETSRFRGVDQARDLDEYEARARDLSFSTGNPLWQDVGDIDPAFESADRVMEAVFRSDPAYHAQMEPMNATASVSADGLSTEIWVSTQTQSLTAMAAADLLGTDTDRITVHAMYIGGGYGRRAEYRQKDVEDALLLSRELGRPVKVIWSREDDVRDGVFRPLAAQYLRAALDADGRITALQQRVATPSVLSYMNEPRWALSRNRDGISMNGAQVTRYAIPNIRAEHVMVDRCSRLAAWRGVATSYTRFANESFIDEIAHAVGADPLKFRLDLTRGQSRWPLGIAGSRADGRVVAPAGRHDPGGGVIRLWRRLRGRGHSRSLGQRRNRRHHGPQVLDGHRRRLHRIAPQHRGSDGRQHRLRHQQRPEGAHQRQRGVRGPVEFPRLPRDAHERDAGTPCAGVIKRRAAQRRR